jgi:hypothetical protein
MKPSSVRWQLTSAVVALGLGCAPLAVAATGPAQGETSGPAAGSQTTPGSAVQKQASSPNGSTAAGAPGTAAKQGTEAGDKPAGSANKGQSSTR